MTKVRLADIAKALGITAVTVSNALNNRYGVSEELRLQITRKAEEMGYHRVRPSKREILEKLRLGVIVPGYYLNEPNAFYWSFYQALSREASNKGITIGMEQLDSNTLRNMVMPKLVNDRNCDLLVLLGPPGVRYLDMVTRATRVPTVCLDVSSPDPKIPTVMSANYYGMAEMCEYLIESGHRKIGYLGTVGSTASVTDRYLGYCRALRSHDIPLNKEWVIDDRKIQNGKVIIELPETLPTAIACNSDRSALVLIELLRQRGIEVPGGISVVSYDGHLPGAENVDLTTMVVNVEEMVSLTIQTLIRLYEGRALELTRFVVAGQRHDGSTVRILAQK